MGKIEEMKSIEDRLIKHFQWKPRLKNYVISLKEKLFNQIKNNEIKLNSENAMLELFEVVYYSWADDVGKLEVIYKENKDKIDALPDNILKKEEYFQNKYYYKLPTKDITLLKTRYYIKLMLYLHYKYEVLRTEINEERVKKALENPVERTYWISVLDEVINSLGHISL